MNLELVLDRKCYNTSIAYKAILLVFYSVNINPILNYGTLIAAWKIEYILTLDKYKFFKAYFDLN